MKDITGSSASFPAQRGFETGDELNETNFDELAQTAADRAAWLKAKVDDMLATGIKKIRVVAGSASLKALTGMVTGDVAFISPASPQTMGLYVFLTTTPLGADIAGWAYDASDASGYWVRDIGPLLELGGPTGTQPRLKTSLLRVPNSILANAHKGWLTANIPMTFDGFGNYDTALVNDNITGLQEDDQVTVHFSAGGIAPDHVSGAGIALTYSVDGGTSYTEIPSSRADVLLDPLPTTTRRIPASIAAQYTLGPGETEVRFMVRGKGSNTYTGTLFGPFTMTTLATRP